MNKEELLNELYKLKRTTFKSPLLSFLEYETVSLTDVIALVEKLDEPKMTQKQAWEVLAPRFSMTAIELERQVLDGFLAMTAEEIEMESDKIRKLADGIKKLHAENEELKAKLDNPEKVVIPQFVADYLENANKEISLLRVFEIANGLSELDMWRKEYNWIRLYHLDFARAWLDGYEIKKEPLYIIFMPKTDDVLACWENEVDFEFTSEASIIGNSDWKYTFTESEIKSIDERFWPFAELVEETP